jgi:hypothetical protein
MPKRTRSLEPVTEQEVRQAVKEALVRAFGDRPLDPDVARRGLAHAGFDLIELKLREVAAKSKRGHA